jgi:hypothetical protein
MATFNISSLISRKFKFYEHTQTANTTWTIPHNLGVIPICVQTYNSSKEEIEGDVDWTNASTTSLTITFPVALAGTAKVFG